MTQPSTQTEEGMRPRAWPSSSPPEFTVPCKARSTVGYAYIVSTWPSLSQTFVLNEVLALERRGLQLRIFSIKDPKDEPVHADARRVRAKVYYLALRRRWKPILQGNLRTLWRHPGAYALQDKERQGRGNGQRIQPAIPYEFARASSEEQSALRLQRRRFESI